MTPKTIFFDLDGTLTDSGEGIINSVCLALQHYDIPIPSREELRVFVGPPLHETFQQFGVPAEKTDEAVEIFRSRYTTVGIYENAPYPGIRELLETLTAHGHRLFVATSKPENMALQVLEHFQLSQYFEMICGATLDRSRIEKNHVIAYLLEKAGAVGNTVMVGDTAFDVLGAASHGIPTIGVSWGYGTVADMQSAGAAAIAHTPKELLKLLEA